MPQRLSIVRVKSFVTECVGEHRLDGGPLLDRQSRRSLACDIRRMKLSSSSSLYRISGTRAELVESRSDENRIIFLILRDTARGVPSAGKARN